MFNWFRRNKENKENNPVTPVVVENKSTVEETKTEEVITPIADQVSLEWAKTAFANIQKQKQQLQETEPEETTLESVSETITEKIESSTIEPETAPSEDTVLEETIEENVPAWLQKSDRLEVLKETAIEPEQELDEDFLWSAQVLANQGRSPDDVSEDEFIWLKKLRQGLGKTRRNLINQLKSVVGQGPLNQEAVMEIEAMLLSADVGIEATDYIITTLQNKLKEEALPPEEAIAYLKQILQQVLDEPLKKLTKTEFEPEEDKLNIWLLTGVNGVGKTTTIGKLAHLAQTSGYKCIIAAADTFRAAAVEQVKVWGERTNTPVICNQGQNTDPAAVVFDGINAAIAREAHLLLVDTAGRLQNKKNLMEELAKIRRIIDKKAINAHIESLLVLDATLGQNGLRQAQIFSEAAQLTGIVLTKLDGTAKGGVALAVCQQLNLPIRFIGAGEGIEDLRPFSSYEFVEALLSA
ncbi:signal recognition particle-docking protein FtsY [Geminocystis sp. NIES-3709]|uniref:signal recognition particle-docking protein FtsY n=1 Tax=Geminocystis sp. NIES-3709 TaxID=1617448 RepID=UPI0005FC4CC1|nr:signal recognition particle-docking protein FtsY [Geminocystis sp. NIES-3709]BAQ64049.1 signal recognition particle receptor protein FtsY [Geminocystis sp. NIES-3709]